MEISTKDLRTQTRELFNAVERGEDVILTYHGKARARITGLATETDKKVSDERPAYGMWKDQQESQTPEDIVREMRKGRQF